MEKFFKSVNFRSMYGTTDHSDPNPNSNPTPNINHNPTPNPTLTLRCYISI